MDSRPNYTAACPHSSFIDTQPICICYCHVLSTSACPAHCPTTLTARPPSLPSPSTMSYYTNSRSPPPLQHPVPTHPAYIPEPPSTPASPQGYQRYTSSPPVQQPFTQSVPGVGPGSRIPPGYTASTGQYQPLGSPPRQPVHGQPHPGVNASNVPVDFSAWGINDATAQFGMQLGQSAVAAGQDYVQKNACKDPSDHTHLNSL